MRRASRRWRVPPTPGRTSTFTRVVERLSALWTLRILLSDSTTNWAAPGQLDQDIANTIGLPDLALPAALAQTSAPVRERLEKRLRELEATPNATDDAFTRNVTTLARVLGLTPVERELVVFVLVMRFADGLANLFRGPAPAGLAETHRLMATALLVSESDVGRALRPDGALRSSGLIALNCEPPYNIGLDPMCGLAEMMLSGRRSARAVMELFVHRAPSTRLDVGSFAHVAADVTAITRLLRGALRRRARGVNILLHGKPGTGKTELARVVASSLGARLFEVSDSDEDGESIHGRDRLAECALAQRALGWSPRALLVFDEIEDAFRVRWEGTRGLVREAGGGQKSWTHRLMEGARVPTFWISNEIQQIDPATLRRFDFVVELRVPPVAVRMKILRDALGETPVDDALLGRLASDERLTPAHVARAVRVARLMGARASNDVAASLSHVLARNLGAQGPARATSTVQMVCGPYDLGLANTTTDLGHVTDAIVRERRASVCLYGPPGTGKTIWAHHLAHKMGVPIRAARASDLLGCYVGETEKAIAALFATARDEGGVLFLDEADSFLQDRAGAHRSWEITQVNELLTQMEGFDGVFICATNLVESLDRAALRRFAMKIEFRPLRSDARWAMLLRLVPGAQGDRGLRAAIDRLDGLTPGDVAAVARQARLAGAEGDARAIVAMLENELALRKRGRGPSRAIGFDLPVMGAP